MSILRGAKYFLGKTHQLFFMFWLQDGRRVVRPQSVADMEELGRNLENMQIVNSRFQRDDEDTVSFLQGKYANSRSDDENGQNVKICLKYKERENMQVMNIICINITAKLPAQRTCSKLYFQT